MSSLTSPTSPRWAAAAARRWPAPSERQVTESRRGVPGAGWYVALLLLVVAALRAPLFFNAAFNSDEMYYAVGARKLLAGGLFYHDVVDHKPPGMYWIYALVMRAMGSVDDLVAVHAASIAAVWLSAVLLARIGTAALGARVGRAAGALYAVTSALGPAGDFLAANGELFLNLPVIAALALTCAPPRVMTNLTAGPYLRAAGAGLLTAAGVLVKPQAAAVGVPLVIYWLTREDRGTGAGVGRPLARAGSALGLLASYVGSALVPAVTLVLGYRAAHALDDLTWALHYGATVYSHALGFREKLVNGLRNSACMALVHLPLLVPAALHLRGVRRGPGARPALLWTAWLLASFAAVCTGGRFYPHYYVQLLPPLCLLAAAGLAGRTSP